MAPSIDLNKLLLWQGITAQLVAMGVKSFKHIRSLMTDAGVDDATIAATENIYLNLIPDVRRAAGLPPK